MVWTNSHLYSGIFNAFGIFLGAMIINKYGLSSAFTIGAAFSHTASIVALKFIKKNK